MIKISKLVAIMCLTHSSMYPVTESFEYSRFDIPRDTFETKIQSGSKGTMWSTKNSLYCYQCTFTASLMSPAVKKIVECVDGECKETYYNPQSGQEITPAEAALAMADISTPKSGQNKTIWALFKSIFMPKAF